MKAAVCGVIVKEILEDHETTVLVPLGSTILFTLCM